MPPGPTKARGGGGRFIVDSRYVVTPDVRDGARSVGGGGGGHQGVTERQSDRVTEGQRVQPPEGSKWGTGG